MTSLPGHRRLALALSIAGLLAAHSADAAAGDGTPPSGAYRDRIIALHDLQELPAEEEEAQDESGLPRSLRVEFLASRNERGGDAYDEHGIATAAYWETAAWGAFSVDATVFDSDRERDSGAGSGSGLGGAATLWQHGLYLDGGWRLDNGLGVLNTPSTPLQRSQYRFFLPTVAFAGASSEWRNLRNDLLVQGSYGRAGLYNGTRLAGFELADGQTASLGAQWRWAPQWTGTAAFLTTNGRIAPDERGEAIFEPGDTRALHAATAWEGTHDRVQLNLLASDSDSARADGAWLDASARRGRYQHNYGAYWLDTGLAWGALPINNDVRGGYYRLTYQYARWNWSIGADRIESISGAGFDGTYANAYARYQASSTLGYGGSLNLRHASGNDYGVQLFLDQQNRWGQTRLQFDQARVQDGSDSWQASVDQALPLRQGSRLSLSAAYGELNYSGEAGANATTTLAIYGGHDLGDRISIDGGARWTHGDGDAAVRGTDVNLGVSWRIDRHWSLNAAFYQSQGSQRSPFVLDPLATEAPFISLPRDRSLYLTLRCELNAGRPQGVIGGSASGPSGSVAGSIYLDDNGDGARAASELPAANVTVVLDGRFATRTDSLGRFDFPRVAPGGHTVVVMPDNLPLPWFFGDAETQRQVQVLVRQASRIDIGARRQP